VATSSTQTTLAARAGAARRGDGIVDVAQLSPESLAHPGVALDAQSAVQGMAQVNRRGVGRRQLDGFGE
jgi:hypothetical protein